MSAASAKTAPKRRAVFLAELAATGNVSLACASAQWDRGSAYHERDKNKEFSAEWDKALEVATDALEAEARRRGVEGVEEPVFYQGEVCGHVQKYSDVLLIALLNAHRPQKFRRNGTVEVHHSFADLICEAASGKDKPGV